MGGAGAQVGLELVTTPLWVELSPRPSDFRALGVRVYCHVRLQTRCWALWWTGPGPRAAVGSGVLEWQASWWMGVRGSSALVVAWSKVSQHWC